MSIHPDGLCSRSPCTLSVGNRPATDRYGDSQLVPIVCPPARLLIGDLFWRGGESLPHPAVP